MRVLLTIPHVFAPKPGSLYSSQTEEKRNVKKAALLQATIGNLCRHSKTNWIHASLGKGQPVVTRASICSIGIDLTIQLFTPSNASLAESLPDHPGLQCIDPQVASFSDVPSVASRRLLEQSSDYDVVGYMEDDLLIEDPDFFHKIVHLVREAGTSYAFLPHRCEHITEMGDVILSGDPDGGRPDLFWDTGERLTLSWHGEQRSFYRATNPHSGCYFLTKMQAAHALEYWQQREWQASFQLSGPLEQAGSGLLLPIFKVMKPIPEHYRCLMVRHQDELWKRHPFESVQNTDYSTRITMF